MYMVARTPYIKCWMPLFTFYERMVGSQYFLEKWKVKWGSSTYGIDEAIETVDRVYQKRKPWA